MGVWIETELNGEQITKERVSHPVWVCGLKLTSQYSLANHLMSHPVWVCGLKLFYLSY